MADRWSGPVGRLGVETSDGRIIERGGFYTRSLPLPLDWQEYTDEGHDKAVTVGTIDQVEVLADGTVWAAGEWLDDAVIDKVAPCRLLVDAGVVYPSVQATKCEGMYMELGGGAGSYVDGEYEEGEPWRDVCVYTLFELAKVTLVATQAMPDLRISDDTGTPPEGTGSLTAAGVRSSGWDSLPVADTDTKWDAAAAEQRVAQWSGIDAADAGQAAWDKYARAFLYQDPDADPQTKAAYKLQIADIADGELELIPRAVYAVAGVLNGARGGTDIPQAQQDKLKTVVTGLYEKIAKAADDDSITAPFASLVACSVEAPPAAWFANPGFTEPTPIEITEDGRIFGHIGIHGQRHRGLAGDVMIPRSMSGYREFLLGHVLTAEGTKVPTGRITLGGGHAVNGIPMRLATEHYDDVSCAVADVTAGDDHIGVWIAGYIKAGVTATQVAELRAAPPSGDWREDQNGNLELITVHSVNSPGFAVYRVGVDEQGRYGLTASSALVKAAQRDFRAKQRPAAPGRPDSGYVKELAAALRAELAPAPGPALSALPVEFDAHAPDLRAEYARHGLAWPTISATLGGRPTGPFDVAEGCVRGMLAAVAGDAPAGIEPDGAQMHNALALELAQAKLRYAGLLNKEVS